MVTRFYFAVLSQSFVIVAQVGFFSCVKLLTYSPSFCIQWWKQWGGWWGLSAGFASVLSQYRVNWSKRGKFIWHAICMLAGAKSWSWLAPVYVSCCSCVCRFNLPNWLNYMLCIIGKKLVWTQEKNGCGTANTIEPVLVARAAFIIACVQYSSLAIFYQKVMPIWEARNMACHGDSPPPSGPLIGLVYTNTRVLPTVHLSVSSQTDLLPYYPGA